MLPSKNDNLAYLFSIHYLPNWSAAAVLAVWLFTAMELAADKSEFDNRPAKPKVIVMTDGEIDDHSSMLRFLLYACDVDVRAIIETNSMFQ